MKVSDLYLIVEDLREISVLQMSILEAFASDDNQHALLSKQKTAYDHLKELLDAYEKYNI